jgi:hypothetical protein
MPLLVYPSSGANNGELEQRTTPPAAPSSGAQLYTRPWLGEQRVWARFSDGRDELLDADPFYSRDAYAVRVGAGLEGVGWALGPFGDVSIPAVTSASRLASTARVQYRTAIATLGAGVFETAGSAYRGDVAGRGGFLYRWEGAWTEYGAAQFSAVGGVSVPSLTDPALTPNNLYVGFVSNQSGLTPTAVGDLEIVSVPAAPSNRVRVTLPGARVATDLMEIVVFARPAASQVLVRVRNLSTGVVVGEQLLSGAGLPAADVMLTWGAAANTASSGVATAIQISDIRLRTPS